MHRIVVPLLVTVIAWFGAVYASTASSLEELERHIHHDLHSIGYPGVEWLPTTSDANQEVFDVVIVGGGQSGLAAAVALQQVGITHIKVLDENPQGEEGPWATYARMHCLRSDKHDAGPSLSIPSLTFQAWYEVQHGTKAWNDLKAPATGMWMDYLAWYRRVMDVPVSNGVKVTAVDPCGKLMRLSCERQGELFSLQARKVVLATGRTGFGAPCLPSWLNGIPKELYAHACEIIDFQALSGKKVAVLGAGASAFDAAAVALEQGADSVHLLVRRSSVPNVNRFVAISSLGFLHGFYRLSDADRWVTISEAAEHGVPPPQSAIERVQCHHNIHLHTDRTIQSAAVAPEGMTLQTNQGSLTCDFLVVACGFDIDGCQRPELASFVDRILLWQDRVQVDECALCPKLGGTPYLGPSFEFQERYPGQATFLKNVYCFNYGALVSHGIVCGSIDGVSICARRLAEGIAADFLIQEVGK